jgi:hypothetical protein
MSILLLGENLSLSQSRFLLVVDSIYFGFVVVVKLCEVPGLLGAKAQCTGNPAYLEPNRDSLQKPIGGLSVLALFTTKNMQPALYKGAIVFSEH